MIPHSVRQRYARLAGLAFLFYIAVGLAETTLFSGAVSAGPAAAKLANVMVHQNQLRLTVVLTLATVLSAFWLAVSLFMVTHFHDLGVALIGMTLRIAEGVIGSMYALPAVGLLSAARSLEGRAPGPEADVLVALLLDTRHHLMMLSAVCFAAGSLAFCYLLLRGRAVHVWLARFGVLASALLLLALPVQLVVDSRGIVSMMVWLPMLLFEVVLAVWLLVRGVAPDVLGPQT